MAAFRTPPTDDLNQWLVDFGHALGRALGASVAAGFREALGSHLPAGVARARAGAGVSTLTPTGHGGRRRTQPELCTIPGCDGKSRAKGLCGKHYQASRQTAKVNEIHAVPEAVPPRIRKRNEKPLEAVNGFEGVNGNLL